MSEASMWTAIISGFSATATDLDAAGWTRLRGDENTGQSATKLLVIQNGIVRVILDRNVSGATGGMRILFFDGSAWGTELESGGLASLAADNFDAVRIIRNDRHVVEVEVQYNDVGTSANARARMAIHAGEPAVRVYAPSESGGFDWTLATSATVTFFEHVPGGTHRALDSLGNATDFSGTNGADWITMRSLGSDVEVVWCKTENANHFLIGQSSLQGWAPLDPDTPPLSYHIGFIERAYGAGDGGGADVGNGDGHLREGEDNFTGVAGTWAKATGVTGASSTAVVRNASPSANDEVSWSINFPQAGDYYVGVRVQATGAGGFLEVGVGGTDSGTPVAIPETAFASQTTQLLFGPYTIASAGNKTVDARISTLGSMTNLDIDHVCVYAFEAATGTVPFPKNLADSLLLRTTSQP